MRFFTWSTVLDHAVLSRNMSVINCFYINTDNISRVSICDKFQFKTIRYFWKRIILLYKLCVWSQNQMFVQIRVAVANTVLNRYYVSKFKKNENVTRYLVLEKIPFQRENRSVSQMNTSRKNSRKIMSSFFANSTNFGI